MFKDYNKYLSASLKVYLFVLGIIFIMKLVRLDYFGLDVNNPMEDKLKEKIEESIKKILDEGITTTNLEHLYKLAKINHIAKEDENMNYRGYGNYGNMGNYGDDYGRRGGRYGEGNYGRRGVPGSGRGRYRGEDMLNEMYEEYGNYMEGGNYGGEETMKALKYMLKSAEDFFKHIQEEVKSPEEIEMVKESARKISMM